MVKAMKRQQRASIKTCQSPEAGAKWPREAKGRHHGLGVAEASSNGCCLETAAGATSGQQEPLTRHERLSAASGACSANRAPTWRQLQTDEGPVERLAAGLPAAGQKLADGRFECSSELRAGRPQSNRTAAEERQEAAAQRKTTTSSTSGGIKFRPTSSLQKWLARCKGPPAHCTRGANNFGPPDIESNQVGVNGRNNKSSLEACRKLELQFSRLAELFKRFVNFYGFSEDVTLLLSGCTWQAASGENGFGKNEGKQSKIKGGIKKLVKFLSKCFWLSMILWANIMMVYVLVSHFIWELRRLDVKMANHERQRLQLAAASSSTSTGTVFDGSSNGWSVLKDFLENLGRHLSRFFAFVLISLWHINCNNFELLFADIRRYFAAFYSVNNEDSISACDCSFGVQMERETLTLEARMEVSTRGQPNGAAESGHSKCRPRRQGSLSSKLDAILLDGQPQIGLENEHESSTLATGDGGPEERSRERVLMETSWNFYQLSRRRILLAICFPFATFLFNLLAIFLFPTELMLSSSASKSHFKAQNITYQASLAANKQLAEGNTDGKEPGQLESVFQLALQQLAYLVEHAMRNFNAFHRVAHTAFHPLDHQLNTTAEQLFAAAAPQAGQPSMNGAFSGSAPRATVSSQFGGDKSGSSAFPGEIPAELRPRELAEISQAKSALFCLAEIFVHYVYVHGTRVISSTCLSLVLALHNLCLKSFNDHLMELIKRERSKPLKCLHMIRLLKQWDMIGLMHERIERAFKVSLVLWFGSMFISCLMQIFTLTESTSVAFAGASATGAWTQEAERQQQQQQQQQQAQPSSASNSGLGFIFAALCPILITLSRISMTLYAPWLISIEAFKLETESARTNQLVVLLSRRQHDPIAQAIEPSLFEPIHLSVGGYFSLSRRSAASLLGAIVTFSIMFIGKCLVCDNDNCAATLARRQANVAADCMGLLAEVKLGGRTLRRAALWRQLRRKTMLMAGLPLGPPAVLLLRRTLVFPLSRPLARLQKHH